MNNYTRAKPKSKNKQKSCQTEMALPISPGLTH